MSQLNFFQRQSRAEHKDQESKQSSSTSDHKCLNGGCIGSSESTLVKIQYCWKSHILTHTFNAKCFRNVTLINIRGFAEIIVPVRGYGRHLPNEVMIKRE